MSKKMILVALMPLLLALPMAGEEQPDSIQVQAPAYTSLVDLKPLRMGLGVVLPMVAYDFMYYKQDVSISRMREHYTPGYKMGWDNVTQFVPLGVTWGMRLSGLEGRSASHWEALSAHAISYAVAMGTVYAGKYLTKRIRPDASNQYSFPSGHTAFAFAGATILDAEYGSRYPWLSAAGYGVATLTAVGRVLNNRHWATDVVTGAGVGIAATYIGYLLNDLMWGRGLERFELTEERENAFSWGYLMLRKGRSDLLTNIKGVYEGKLGSDVTLLVRYPMYRQIGLQMQGSLWESFNPEHAEGVQSFAVLLGADFMQGFWHGRLWVDSKVGAGYHLPIKLSKGYRGTPRTEALQLTKGGFVAQASVGLSYVLTDHMALNLAVDYTLLPKYRLKGFGGSVGLAYIF
ncbi:phosphatase PAP2 family protein [Porphyromonas levii]|uniref:phosphatase PAP2 family protein n=1 Tax=Porphyromonas levii TaxID=28114 RepID=UPI001BA6AC8C|nr:phosphatase PAP2 family protein [Porphyromonas levii]